MATKKDRLLVTLGDLSSVLEDAAARHKMCLAEYIRYLIISDNVDKYEQLVEEGSKDLPRGCKALHEHFKQQQV